MPPLLWAAGINPNDSHSRAPKREITYAQVFLCANEEQLDGGGVVLLQGVFEPLPAEETTRLYTNIPQLESTALCAHRSLELT